MMSFSLFFLFCCSSNVKCDVMGNLVKLSKRGRVFWMVSCHEGEQGKCEIYIGWLHGGRERKCVRHRKGEERERCFRERKGDEDGVRTRGGGGWLRGCGWGGAACLHSIRDWHAK